MNLARQLKRRAFWGMLAWALGLSITWGILIALLQAGWWILAINITFFILTVLFVLQACRFYFRPQLSTWVTILIGAGIWVLMAVLIRSLVIDVISAM